MGVETARKAVVKRRSPAPAPRGSSPRLRTRNPQPALAMATPTRSRCRSSPAASLAPRSSCVRTVSGLFAMTRARCVCSCRASTSPLTRRPRRCRCGVRSWRRWSASRSTSTGGGVGASVVPGASPLGGGPVGDGGGAGRDGPTVAPGAAGALPLPGLCPPAGGASWGDGVPGGEEERGRGDRARAVLGWSERAGSGLPCAGEAVVLGGGGGGGPDGGRGPGAAAEGAAAGGPGAAAHDEAGSSTR